jgi:hypothetical protein
MKKIDLKQIIKSAGLDSKEVAKQLFPGNKYPVLAFNRVMSGSAELDASQISKLALLAGTTISGLYGVEWKSVSKKDSIEFTTESYKAELDTKTWITKIFDNETLFHESIIHSGSISISEYLRELNLLISKHRNNHESSRN